MELVRQPIPSVAPQLPRGLERGLDERAARRSLREQVSRLEAELGYVLSSSFPRSGVDVSVAMRGGPRMLGLGELERLRDRLAERLSEARRSSRPGRSTRSAIASSWSA